MTVSDSFWVVVFEDTVIARLVSFLFQDELVADKYGVVEIYPEQSPPEILTGMIINGVKYGNIVGANELNTLIVSEYRLENNFPNPFNLSTTIKFSISETGFVILKINDMLGKEVAVLVNEKKSAGNYSVNFNAEHLASGIYIYSLTSGQFTSSKKLILLK